MKPAPETIARIWQASGLPAPVCEWRFHQTRKWRFDFAWPDFKVACEQDGGIHSFGRHSRGSGIVKDMEKFNAAAELGWRVLKFQPKEMLLTSTIQQIKMTLNV